ncbi:MAG: alanine dehydrogenase [Christensenellales bacterium]|jgi:alanine dehydrogenase
MIIGVPIEIKKHEYRVGLTPGHAVSYVNAGHKVYIQKGAGVGSGFMDEEYVNAGCEILPSIEDIYAAADMIIKVKEPLEPEYELMREGQIFYTYFHLAAEKELTEACLKNKIIAIAYETIVGKDGRLPCLKPMSEIAGRLSIQEGAKYLEKPFGGKGILLGGVPGVLPANVVILGGGGVVGRNACALAVGLHSDVTVVDISNAALTYIDDLYHGRVKTLYSTEANIIDALKNADLVIGAALVPGAATPHLIKREYLKYMKRDSIIVDVAIDQGGCAETSRVTYHDDPVYKVDGVVHYCVGNMPGAVPGSSTLALNNATLSYGLKIAADYKKALRDDVGLSYGLNTHLGDLTIKPVADLFGLPYKSPLDVL